MTSDDLTTDQAERMCGEVIAQLRSLGKVLNRMRERNFPFDDPLRKLMQDAYDKMQHLRMDLHYRSCAAGTGRNRKPK